VDADQTTDATTDPVVGDGASAAPADSVTTAELPDDGTSFETAAHENPAEIERQRQERARKRLRQTARDMLISMLVVAGAVLLLVLPWNRGPADPIKTVDPAPVIAGARASQSWPVMAPTGQPATWRCTSARISTASDGQDIVHLGYLTPSTTYVGLEQSATKETAFVRDQTLSADKTGTRVIGSATWTTYETADGAHRSYVLVQDGATYVVTGSATWDDLTTFTASLRAG
jgi:hypothetical protein